MGCVLKVSAKSQFLKRFKRSEAVERLEHLERASVCVRVAFHAEKTRSKPLERAIYTIFYWLINGLRRSDPEPGFPSH